MKKFLHSRMIVFLVIIISIFASAASAFAWGLSTHAYVAKESLGIEYRYLRSYNARMGSIIPDYFWYLRDSGLIDQETALKLHGVTEDTEVTVGTTFFYEIASGNLTTWDSRLMYFTEGTRIHFYADVKAHNTMDGYVEGSDMWCDLLHEKTKMDRETLHMAIEFAVDSLLVNKYGLQLCDIVFSYKQAIFLEETVEEAFDEMNITPDFDVSAEFKKYLALMRALEKAAIFYAPYLIQGEVNEDILSRVLSSELLDAQSELSDDSLGMYLKVLMVLQNYPKEIYNTINTQGMHWENDALPKVIEFCTLN
ncbi:MAG: hypothetical protein SWO11_10650 [Thermodesulfobacteriota bacterium]|nr:hypothetical protein [Thermodesulfobacteriota bacterium]